MCTCGDTCCPSCGPAQGNYFCAACGQWSSDDCLEPKRCADILEYDREWALQQAAQADAEAADQAAAEVPQWRDWEDFGDLPW
jgi:hypothetical protein